MSPRNVMETKRKVKKPSEVLGCPKKPDDILPLMVSEDIVAC